MFFCLTYLVWGQGVEIQRKYTTEQISQLRDFVLSSKEVNEFHTFNYASYVYFDLYMDTPEYTLLKKGFSLRMRKKCMGDEGCFYTFQLKSEMTSGEGVRMEIEEPELDFYKLVHQGEETNLAHLLNLLFQQFQSAKNKSDLENYADILSSIQEWISIKANAPIAPFQKLKFLYPDLFTAEKIRSLAPKMIGESHRHRGHVYVGPEYGMKKFGAPLRNVKRGDDEPVYFKENSDKYWVIESSLDSSVFYPLFPSSLDHVLVQEYEIENKYEVDSIGMIVLNEFEKEMRERFALRKTVQSKYVQSINQLRE